MKLNKRTFVTLISMLIILSTLLSACQLGLQPMAITGVSETASTGNPEKSPAGIPKGQAAEPTLTPSPEPLPPYVIQVTPIPGEEQALDAPLQVVFDQPMDANSVPKSSGVIQIRMLQ